MKNVQIIDGADNCSYLIFAFTDEEIEIIFPEHGQDIESSEDVIARVGDTEVGEILGPVWKRPVIKTEVAEIHGTLFYELAYQKEYYPSKRDSEML